MGARWLHDFPQALAGIPDVTYYPGWQTRSRSSGGFDNLYGIVCHHTATNRAGSFEGYCRVAWTTHPERPVANISLGRAGEICVGVAGASNHAGKGGPTRMSKGTVPLDSGNRYLIGIEPLNEGTGEPWPDVQQDRYIALVQALCAFYGFDVNTDVVSHNLWTPARKIDPAGPSRFGSINQSGTWDMNLFRSAVTGAPAPQPPEPAPPSAAWYDQLMAQMPVLTPGIDNYWYVKRMQHLIAAAGFMNEGNVSNYDGKFGSGTAGALNKFKQSAGGSADSTCDAWTWGALMHTIDGIATITKGMKGGDVKRMQHLLAANGYMNEGNVSNYDGVWGSGTEQAKINYDNAAGLTPSPPSDCGKKSWTYLLTV
jgi:peptidoglycan hydrolase-like protein with peptidoglycan-binding domain